MSEASSFQSSVSRGRRTAFSGRLVRVLQRLHSTSIQPSPPLATVLKNLIRSWKMVANQMALYEAIIKDQK